MATPPSTTPSPAWSLRCSRSAPRLLSFAIFGTRFVAHFCLTPGRTRMPAAEKSSSNKRKSRKHKYGPAAAKSVASALHREKRGTLKSGKGGKGGRVTSRQQAIAIGLSEARERRKSSAKEKLALGLCVKMRWLFDDTKGRESRAVAVVGLMRGNGQFRK